MMQKLSQLTEKNLRESSKWAVKWHAFKCFFARHDYRLHEHVAICNWCPEKRKRWRDDKGGYLPLSSQGIWTVRVYERGKDDQILFIKKLVYHGTCRRHMMYVVWRQQVRWGAPKIIIEWTPH